MPHPYAVELDPVVACLERITELERSVRELEERQRAPTAPDVYRDTAFRMQHDAEFNSAVMLLVQVARQHGFTPGELKQIAFQAALYVEERRTGRTP